jgi:hypothetical protein|tara:strand:- start:152 stop:544 length:393 start_codon:yes stop_codon:yes gene_type:complete
MKTIKFNGKNLAVSAAEERALFTLSRNNFTAMTSDFYERRGRYGESILPANKDRRQRLGISYIERLRSLEWLRNVPQAVHDVDGMTYRKATARERKFFTEHPRCECVITGNPRRTNAILKALDAEVEGRN